MGVGDRRRSSDPHLEAVCWTRRISLTLPGGDTGNPQAKDSNWEARHLKGVLR